MATGSTCVNDVNADLSSGSDLATSRRSGGSAVVDDDISQLSSLGRLVVSDWNSDSTNDLTAVEDLGECNTCLGTDSKVSWAMSFYDYCGATMFLSLLA